MRVVCDTEFNSLIMPDKFWVAVCKDIDTQEVYTFERPDLNPDAFTQFAQGVSLWIGHHFVKYDAPNITRFIPSISFTPTTILDTLVVSRLLNFGIQGGHSVEAWASRLNLPIQKRPIADFTVWSDDLVLRCQDDVDIQYRLFKHFEKWIYLDAFKTAIPLEHEVEFITREIQDNGFPFDHTTATALHVTLRDRLASLDAQLKEAFPPKPVVTQTIVPRYTQRGTLHAVDAKRLVAGGFDLLDVLPDTSYDIIELQEFNPGSLQQVIDRLWDAGWKPTDKTKGHIEALKPARYRDPVTPEQMARFQRYGWKLSEENILTLPDTAPAATKVLTERLLIAGRVSDLEEWLALTTAPPSPGEPYRLHPQIMSIGAWTQRLASQKPNIQNIPVPQGKDNPSELDQLSDHISAQMRQLFQPEPGHVLVGTDADGIQMRIFAHYVNDQRLIEALIKGDKANATDIHSLHWRALGRACKGRNPAKTFIYAWLLGAGVGKVAEILECSQSDARQAIESFIGFYPSLKDLKDGQIPADARRGYFVGIDGRFVMCDSEHKMLAGYLQNGETLIMRKAATIWKKDLTSDGVSCILHTWPHDEWQSSARPEEAEHVGKVQADSIRKAALEFGMNLPFAGQYKIGANWLETH